MQTNSMKIVTLFTLTIHQILSSSRYSFASSSPSAWELLEQLSALRLHQPTLPMSIYAGLLCSRRWNKHWQHASSPRMCADKFVVSWSTAGINFLSTVHQMSTSLHSTSALVCILPVSTVLQPDEIKYRISPLTNLQTTQCSILQHHHSHEISISSSTWRGESEDISWSQKLSIKTRCKWDWVWFRSCTHCMEKKRGRIHEILSSPIQRICTRCLSLQCPDWLGSRSTKLVVWAWRQA